MNEKSIKSIVCGVILALIFLSVTTTLEARNIVKDETDKGKCINSDCVSETIEIVIQEHFSDGISTQRIQQIKISDFEALTERLSNVSALDEKFKILKEYNIIKEDVTIEKYEKNIKQTLDNIDIKKDLSNKITPLKVGRNIILLQNLMCAVYLVTDGINIPIGLSLITAYINEEILNNYTVLIPSIDFIDLCFGYAFFRTSGPLGRIRFGGDKTFSGLVGFAGISVREKKSIFTARNCMYLGFSIYAYSLIFNI